jgi:hypothetical protein
MIQFHATLDELVDYLNSVSHEFGLVVTIMTHFPFTLKESANKLFVDDLPLDRSVRIILTKDKPNIEASSAGKFYDMNNGAISLSIGQLTEKGLEESAFGFMSDDEDKIIIANKLSSRLKKITKAGCTAVNSINGAERKIRSHRYTIGAKRLHDEGVRILSHGNVFFRLPD